VNVITTITTKLVLFTRVVGGCGCCLIIVILLGRLLHRRPLRQSNLLGEVAQERAQRGRVGAVLELVADGGAVAVVEHRPDLTQALASHEIIVGSKAIVVDERAGDR